MSEKADETRGEGRRSPPAHHDALTGLPNRLGLAERLKSAVAQAARRGRRLALLCLDLDRFRFVNDSLGPARGDRLLRLAADRLRGCIREEDALARVGGDEFMLLLPEIARPIEVAEVAERILENLKKTAFDVDGHELAASASIGVSLFPHDGRDAESLMRNAGAAMHRAKELGRDTYQLYDPAMTAAAEARLSLERDLRRALSRDELEVHYQPILDVARPRLHGFEALLRWRSPDKGLVAPAEFVPLAEVTGQILTLGPWVLSRACTQLKAWQESGHAELRVAVNVSLRQLHVGDLLNDVKQALRDSGVDPRFLELEITESSAMQNVESALGVLRQLKNLGVRLAIDDFGVGQSSIAQLRRLPVDVLKLDRSFIRDVTLEDGVAIVRAVIAMAHALRLEVVAEGVESEEQHACLAAEGCDRAQGYLLGRPAPHDQCGEFLQQLGAQVQGGSWHVPRRADP